MPGPGLALAVGAVAAAGGLPPFGPGSVLTATRLEPAPVLAVLVAAGAYLYGVSRLRRRGDRWPGGRTAALAGGLATVLLATTSGLADYGTSLFGVHMVQHMLLTMLAPVLLALGAPVTLALRTLAPSPRRRLLALLHSRVVAVLTFPLVGWVLFVATPFALYSTGWYEATLRSGPLHGLLHAVLVLVGSLFFWPLLGVDPVPGRRGYPLRMLLVAVTLPFHAFLGVSLMSVTPDGASLIGRGWYLGRQPVEQAVFQQQVGGALLWASGDLVGLLFLAVLLAQWMRASAREAAREDRRLDRLEAAAAARAGAADRVEPPGPARAAGPAGAARPAGPV